MAKGKLVLDVAGLRKSLGMDVNEGPKSCAICDMDMPKGNNGALCARCSKIQF